MNWTKGAVLLFIILLLWAAFDARGDNGARVSLGHTVFNSQVTVGEVGYEYEGWEVAATQMGSGSTKRGDVDVTPVYSVSYLVEPRWGLLWGENYYRLGVAYVDGSPLVGDTNFRLGIGVNYYDVFSLEYVHYSSAGIHETNTGIDAIQLRFHIPNK